MSDLLHLSAAGEFRPLGDESSVYPKDVAGQPCVYLAKDLIHCGHYVHPSKGFEVPVDRQRLDGWVANFRRMREHGVKVPINLDHSDRAADCLGYIVDMSRQGDTLHAICQFIGENAAELAARNYVSVGIDPAYKDGQNNAYGDAIVHVALTPVPIVPDQSHFALAANIQQAPVLALAAVTTDPSPTNPSIRTLSCSPSTLRGLNRLVPGFERASENQKIACLCRHLQMIAGLDEKYGLAPKRMHLWNFDPDQPRDENGQWTATGSSDTGDDSKHTICFAAGTLVLMADGSTKAIELIQSGEQVLSAPESNPEDQPAACKVAQVYHN